MVTRQYKKIKMCHVNIQSLGRGDQGITSNANLKLDQIRTVLQLEHQFEVIGISETWFTPAVSDDDIALQDYTLHRKDRTDRRGVCCYIKTSITSRRRVDLEKENMEIIWTELLLKPKSIIVGIAYRPPGMNRPEAQVYIQDLQEMLTNVMSTSYESMYLLGDFNDRCTEWNSRHNQSELNDDLLNTTTAFGLHQMIN